MARMPSSRAHPLNPRAVPPPGAPLPAVRTVSPALAAATDETTAHLPRGGGFHESSYELNSGLDVIESEWPDGCTVPGPLGPR